MPTPAAASRRRFPIHKRKQVVAPFTADASRADQYLPVDDTAPSATGAQNGPEHRPLLTAGAINCFTQGKTVGIVGNTYLATQRHAKIRLKWMPVQAIA